MSRNLTGLRQSRLLAAAHHYARSGRAVYASVLLHEAAALEPYLLEEAAPTFAGLLPSASTGLLAHVGALAAEAGDYKTAYLAEHKLRLAD